MKNKKNSMDYKYKVIIPTYREDKQLNKCLRWIKRINKLDKVIVINDNEIDYNLNIKYKSVKILNTGGGYWWGGSINFGIKKLIKVGADFVILLNSDNWAKSDIVNKLIRKYDKNSSIIHAATVVNQNDIVRCTSGQINFYTYEVRMFNHKEEKQNLNSNKYYGNYNGGMGVLIPINVIRKIGYLDESFKLSADREYFYRAYKYGIPVCAYEDIIIYTDDDHKAIDRSKIKSKNKIQYKLLSPLNFRSPVYYKTIYKFYKKHSDKPFLYTINALINYFI